MKTHGYRSRKELDKERSKKEHEAGLYDTIHSVGEVAALDGFFPIHDSFYTDLKAGATYPIGAGADNLWTISKQADGYFKSHDGETFQWEFKTAPDADNMLHVSPPCSPFFDPERVRRAAMGGKSVVALNMMRELIHEKVVDDFLIHPSVQDIHRRLSDTHADLRARKLYSQWMRDPYIAKIANMPIYDTEMSVDVNQLKRWSSTEEQTKSGEQIIADILATMAELAPKPNVLPPIDRMYPHQRKLMEMLHGADPVYAVRCAPRRTGMSTLFAAAYGRAWYERNRITEKLHSMQGDFRPHKVNLG